MVKLRQYFGKIAAYVGHLSQVSIDADKDWKGKKITNIAPFEYSAIPDNLPLSKIPVHSLGLHKTVASDTLAHSNDDEKQTTSKTYVKLKEIKINEELSNCRIKFELWYNYDQTSGYGIIYKNGSPIGTERIITVENTWFPFSEDFADFHVDDLIQIYVRIGGGISYRAHVRNMRICYSEITTRVSPTNQDP